MVQSHRMLWCGVAGFIALSSSTALAQFTDDRRFDANRLRVTPSREDILNVYSGRVPEHLNWDMMLWLNYADDPVTLNSREADGSYERFLSLLKHRADAHLIGSLALFDVLQLSIDLPVTVYQERSDPLLDDSGIDPEIDSGGIGDIGFTAKVQLLRDARHGVDLAFVQNVTVPSARPRDEYLGERRATATPEVALSKTFNGFTLGTNLAARFREIVRERGGSLAIEHEAIVRAGARYDFSEGFDVPVTVDLTWEGFTQLKELFERRNTGGSELLLGAGVDAGSVRGVPVRILAGAGLGLQPGYSIPDYRVFAGLGFHQRDGDRDGDGLKDSQDSCPDEPEDLDSFEDANGCPDIDNDSDGVLDVDDGAPLDPEDADGFEDSDGVPDPDNDQDGVIDTEDGCPMEPGEPAMRGCPDSDGDGVADVEDQCRDEAEDADKFEDEDGCPDPDNDADGVLDVADVCLNEPGIAANQGCPDADRDGDTVVDRMDNCPDVPGSPENNGCKKRQLVTIKGCKIDLSQKVFFQTGRATIRPVSFALLKNVAQVLIAQDNIKRVRIEGHTDSRGSAASNKSLSERRAQSVRDYLVREGIDTARLEAVGLGEEKPIDTNETGRGRENNRRVEMVIDDCQEVQQEAGVEQ
ncbi:MAG: OmpA family protein [Myxococcota bacterium]